MAAEKNHAEITGNLYVYSSYRYNIELIERSINASIASGAIDGLRLDMRDRTAIQAIEAVVFPTAAGKTFLRYYISVANNCRPEADLANLRLLVRPEVGPRLDAIFPGEYVPALCGQVVNVDSVEGGILKSDELVWVPKGPARPFEIKVNLQAVDAATNRQRWENNILTANILQQLPVQSEKTEEQLRNWFEYLNWREAQLNRQQKQAEQNNARNRDAEQVLNDLQGNRALLTRLRKTLERFSKYGSPSAPFLASYLFDITQAQVPTSLPELEYQNQNLNANQKRAVQVILAAPEIAVIQGPPGAGKTTVIAEAINQFVRLGKTVLLSSQSIAAVDNAMERLNIAGTEIRPVRLKKNVSEFDDGDNPFVKPQAVESWYKTLRLPAQSLLDSWLRQDRMANGLTKIHRSISELIERGAALSQHQQRLTEQIEAAHSQIQQLETLEEQYNRMAVCREQGKRFIHSFTLNADAADIAAVPDPAQVPSNYLTEFERQILPVFSDLSNLGCNPFFNFDARLKPQIAVQTALRGHKLWRSIFSAKPELAQLVERLSRQLDESIQDPGALEEIQSLKMRREEINDLLDQPIDDQLFHQLRREAMTLRERQKTLESQGGLPSDLIRRVYNIRDARGTDVAQYLLDPTRTRSEVLPILQTIVQRLPFTANNFAAAITRWNQSDTDSQESSEDRNPLDRQLAQQKRRLTELQPQLGRLQRSREDLNNRFKQLRNEYAQLTGESDQTIPVQPEPLQQRLKQSLNAAQQQKEQAQPLRKEIAPVLEKWSTLLERSNNSESEQILPIYVPQCNVAGVTCTESPITLSDEQLDRFDVVIIDEVSKATLPELLIPIMRGRKVVLIGDHRQLPPTFSGSARLDDLDPDSPTAPDQITAERDCNRYRQLVENSLFKSYFAQADDRIKASLNIQFRMHDQIMALVNFFYDNQLKSGLTHPDQQRRHGLTLPYLPSNSHVMWIDSSAAPNGSNNWETRAGASCSNKLEAQLILQTLIDIDANLVSPCRKSVGVIAFYAAQKSLLNRTIQAYTNSHGRFRRLDYRISTVDRFQGQEKDYILVSMTRDSRQIPQSRNAFIKRFERVNVAFSRAKELLIVVGSQKFFQRVPVTVPDMTGAHYRMTPLYREIIDYAKRLKSFVPANKILPVKDF